MQRIKIKFKINLLIVIAGLFLLYKNLYSEYLWQIIPFNSISTLTDVHFFNDTDGIIIGDSGTYLVSSNGGANWFEFPKLTKKNLTSVSFIDSNFGIITSYDTVFITKDGAKNWQKKGFGLDSYFYKIGFSDKNNLWIVGDSGNLLFSTDRGENWNISKISTGKDLFNIYVINKNKILISGSDGFIARIINNGELIEYLDIGYDSFITSMYFINENTGFVSIDSLKILKTTDAGNSWTAVHIGNPDDWIMSFEFTDDNEGWAVTDMGLILKTTDSGDSWHEIMNTGRPLNSCFFLNKHFGFITGFMGTIYRYSDFINSVRVLDKLKNDNNNIIIDQSGIKLKNLGLNEEIEIFNSLGSCIYKDFINSGDFIISTKNLVSGIYFLRLNKNVIKFLKY